MQDGHQDEGRSDGGPLRGPQLSMRRAGLDDYSTIRHVHASAIRALADGLLSEAEIANAVRIVYSPDYVSDLIRKSQHVAVLNGDIVGTCAWSPGDDRGVAARLSLLFVAPLFQGIGIGRRLVGALEQDARDNGFDRFAATVPVSVVPLFEAIGYATASHGVARDVIPGATLQVAFLRKPD